MSNVYDIVNSKISELLESGTIPWKKPWHSSNVLPRNLVSNKAYRGFNVFMLACQSYASPYWLTFKQAQALGGNVKKGEKSTPIVYWQMIEKEDDTTVPILRYYSVFNTDQCENVEVPYTEPKRLTSPIEEAEKILAGMPMRPELNHGGGTAYYSPTLDYVQMPLKSDFDSDAAYYHTLFHELVHSTGHVSRLGRKSVSETSYFGSHEYSKEELVAEIGAAFICGKAGIVDEVIENTAGYIQGWLKALKDDRTLLISAAAQGHKAADYILGECHD